MKWGIDKILGGLGYQKTSPSNLGGDKSRSNPATPDPLFQNPNPTQNITPQIKIPKTSLTWVSCEFEQSQKSKIWYINLTLISLTLALAIFFLTGRNDYLTPGSILIGAMMLAAFSYQKPKNKKIILESHPKPQITINEDHYFLSEFESFAIDYTSTSQEFATISFLKRDKFFTFYITILAPLDAAPQVLALLDATIPERDLTPHAADWLSKKIGL